MAGQGPDLTRPIIGITTSRGLVAIGPEWLDSTYTQTELDDAVLAAGGVPVLVPIVPADARAELWRVMDAVILTGGGDVGPASYEAAPHPRTLFVDQARDEFEIALVKQAMSIGAPVFGICRGMQVLNVALGGALEQHLPEEGPVDHRPYSVPDARTVHAVEVDPASRVFDILGERRLQVNSTHHQAVSELVLGLVATARADDETIEALEFPDGASLVIGVQWHPESLAPVERAHMRLFESFVRAAGDFRRRRAGVVTCQPLPTA